MIFRQFSVYFFLFARLMVSEQARHIFSMTDEDYKGLARINAVGGRYYEPAPVFNVYGGVVLSYAF